ncbi:MAG TPA: hypothetical protein VNR87_07220 [Flavisolibacter sp.]|nr:hypothetical protein [Flavisolibacter sp.]
MRKFAALLLVSLVSTVVFAQGKPDINLNRRLQTYKRLTRDLNFEEIMNYTHPKMFTLAPKDEMIKVFRQIYDNDKFKMFIDSTAITSVSPSFKVGVTDYRRVDYAMKLTIQFKDTSATDDPNFVATIIQNLQRGYPDADVTFDQPKKSFIVRASSLLFAIKDTELSQWMFLGYQKNDDMIKLLYPQEVIEHFKLL